MDIKEVTVRKGSFFLSLVMMLFQSELGLSVLDCWAGPLTLDVGLLCKNKKQKGSAGARPLPLRCLSQFFPVEEKINCLGNEVLCVPFTDGVAWYL